MIIELVFVQKVNLIRIDKNISFLYYYNLNLSLGVLGFWGPVVPSTPEVPEVPEVPDVPAAPVAPT